MPRNAIWETSEKHAFIYEDEADKEFLATLFESYMEAASNNFAIRVRNKGHSFFIDIHKSPSQLSIKGLTPPITWKYFGYY